jgi:hypothetical protein
MRNRNSDDDDDALSITNFTLFFFFFFFEFWLWLSFLNFCNLRLYHCLRVTFQLEDKLICPDYGFVM